MAITAKLYEDALGADENPWATDTDSNTIAIDATGGSGVMQIVDSEDDLTSTNATGPTNRWKGRATTPATFADGVIRALLKTSDATNFSNNKPLLILRAASGAVGVEAAFGGDGGSGQVVDVRNYSGSFIGSTAITMNTDVWYEAVFYLAGTTAKILFYADGSFPAGSDYKTVTWTYTNTSASYTAAAGNAAVGGLRNQSSQPTHRLKSMLSFASTSGVAVATVGLTVGDTLLTINMTDAAAKDKRSALWYFLRYQAGSQPADENAGTLITGTGSGLAGGGIRSDGRFIDDPANFNLTGLTNGTVYYVRPFAVMADGTIVAGTASSATPTGSDLVPPAAPTDFVASYAYPFVASRVDLSWTNPAEAGDYRIVYRTDGTNPTSSTDGTVLQDWTAYTSGSAGSKSATALTNGLRYRFAIWHRDAASNISTGARAQKVACKQVTLYQPTDGTVGAQQDPFLVWHTSQGEAEDGRPINYQIEISTSEVDEASFIANRFFTISSLDDGIAGFQYENMPGAWLPLPAAGLASADVGKDVRYGLSLSVSLHLYWRVSAQQAAV